METMLQNVGFQLDENSSISKEEKRSKVYHAIQKPLNILAAT